MTKNVSWNLNDIFWGLVLLLPLTVLILFSASLALRFLAFFLPFLKGFALPISFGLASFFSGVILVGWLAFKRHKATRNDLGLKFGWIWVDFFYAFMAELVVLIALGLYATLLLRLFGTNLPTQPVMRIFGTSLTGFIFAFISVAVLAPFSEELFFRGFVYAGLREYWGATRAKLASAAIFAFFHFQPLLFVPLFIIGLILAELYEIRKNLLAPYLMHALNNGLALLVLYFATR